jgi:pyruvate kinase
MVQEMDDADDLFQHAIDRSEEEGLVKEGDLVVLTAGVPLGISGTTNLLKAQMV